MQRTRSSTGLAESLKELAEAGCLVDRSVAGMKPQYDDVEINQVGESMVFDLPHGGTGFILDLEFINQTSRPIYCSELPDLPLPWEDPLFEWLPDPKEQPRRVSYFQRDRKGRRELVHATSDSYGFFGGIQLEYSDDMVLNHVLLKRGILGPGRPLRGLLLGRGGQMPVELRHSQEIETVISLISSRHIAYTAKAVLWTDRMMAAKQKSAGKTNLYDKPISDVIPNAPARVNSDIVDDFGIRSATLGSGRSDLTEDPRS